MTLCLYCHDWLSLCRCAVGFFPTQKIIGTNPAVNGIHEAGDRFQVAENFDNRVSLSDLECAIERYSAMLANAPTRSERETAWQWLREAHGLRSSERVIEMEQQQGLA